MLTIVQASCVCKLEDTVCCSKIFNDFSMCEKGRGDISLFDLRIYVRRGYIDNLSCQFSCSGKKLELLT